MFSSLERALGVGIRMTKDAGVFLNSSPLVIVNSCVSESLREIGEIEHIQCYFPYYHRLKSAGLNVTSDFQSSCSQVLIIGSRVREVNRMRIAQARKLVAPGGAVAVAVCNEFGSKSVRKDFGLVFKDLEGGSKGHCRVFWSNMLREDSPEYKDWLALCDFQLVEGTNLLSSVGSFSYRKPDTASLLLASVLPQLKGRGADLGAGYGLLGQKILGSRDLQTLYAVEAGWEAVSAGKQNLKDGRVKWIWGDVTDSSTLMRSCGIGRDGKLDWVIMNPPFHTEGREDQELGVSFFRSALRLLRPKGKLYWVANKHLAYPRLLGWKESSYERLADDHGFMVGRYEVPAQ